MHINITARRFTLHDDLKEYVEKEVTRLERFYDGVLEADVVLGWEKRIRFIEITMTINGTVLASHDRSENMKKSVDSAVEKMERQIKKYNDKKHKHRTENLEK